MLSYPELGVLMKNNHPSTMAEAITSSHAPKVLIPLHQESIVLVGASRDPLPHLVETLLDRHVEEVINDV